MKHIQIFGLICATKTPLTLLCLTCLGIVTHTPEYSTSFVIGDYLHSLHTVVQNCLLVASLLAETKCGHSPLSFVV